MDSKSQEKDEDNSSQNEVIDELTHNLVAKLLDIDNNNNQESVEDNKSQDEIINDLTHKLVVKLLDIDDTVSDSSEISEECEDENSQSKTINKLLEIHNKFLIRLEKRLNKLESHTFRHLGFP
jgi:hypothetical protein